DRGSGGQAGDSRLGLVPWESCGQGRPSAVTGKPLLGPSPLQAPPGRRSPGPARQRSPASAIDRQRSGWRSVAGRWCVGSSVAPFDAFLCTSVPRGHLIRYFSPPLPVIDRQLAHLAIHDPGSTPTTALPPPPASLLDWEFARVDNARAFV